MSSPGPLCHDFSQHLEHSFSWLPSDLSLSSHSCSSIVALSPSEIARLGLRHSESTLTSFQSRQDSDIDIQSRYFTSSHPGERIYDLGTPSATKSAEFVGSTDHPGRDNDILLNTPSSSVLLSSASHDFSFQSSLCRERPSTEDNFRLYAASHRRVSSNSDISPRDAVRYRPRSCPRLANDDTPSALDFHINTFPSLLASNAQPLPAAASQGTTGPYPSDTLPSLQSSDTSEICSPLPTLSDRSDLYRQLICFASPTFSLSQFPSSLSSPAFDSSEVSGDDTAFLPQDLGTGDIIVDMTPEDTVRQMGQTQERGQSKRIAKRIANFGGKFKQALLKRFQALRMQNKTRLSETYNDDYSSSIVDESQLPAPNTPPGLAALLVSGVDSTIQTTTVQDAELPLILQAIPPNGSRPNNSMRKRFSLSLFARPSSIIFSSETRKRRQARPKSMSDLSNQYPTRSTLVGSCGSDNPDIMPVLASTASKRSKKLSLLF